jgi:hypothetical protein
VWLCKLYKKHPAMIGFVAGNKKVENGE